MENPQVWTAVIGLVGVLLTVLGGVAGALIYLWRKDPAAARNGTIDRLALASTRMAEATLQMNKAHEDFLVQMQRYEERNRSEHEKIMEHFERLADIVAPRGGRSL